MTAASQHDFHPDVECLSAFAEQELSERERGEVLAHLAVCRRCRQVVAVASQALEIEAEDRQLVAAAAPMTAVTVQARPGDWWRKWRLVWVPAAVAAAFTVTSLAIYLRRSEQGNATVEVAKESALHARPAAALSPTEPATAAPQPSPAPPRVPAAQRVAEPPAKPVPLPQAAPAPVLPQPAGASPPRAQTAANAGIDALRMRPAAAVPAAPESQAQRAFPALPPPAITETVTVAQAPNAPETTSAGQAADEALQPAGGTALFKSPATTVPQVQLKAAERKKLTDENRQLEAATAKNQILAASSAAPAKVYRAGAEANAPPSAGSQQITSNAAAIAGFAAAPNLHGASFSKPLRLPSGLEIASIASASHRLVAIDKAGTVFLSVDNGDTWQHITPDWTGRAVLVRTKKPASGPLTAKMNEKESGAGGVAASPATFFEIVNDKSQVWQSTDGMVWLPK